jgi:hypothetical protein
MKPSVSVYQIEKSEILRKAYQLLAYFLANEQIARIAHPDKSDDPLKALDARFIFQETSTLLLEVAILFRSLDDQLKISANPDKRDNYLKKVASTNDIYYFDIIDKLSIRECCNKIIHATIFEPLVIEGLRAHTKDYAAFYGDDDKEIVWHHFSGNVRIAGTYNNNDWAYIISVPEFVEALAYLLGNG